jgi:hypothetical protein
MWAILQDAQNQGCGIMEVSFTIHKLTHRTRPTPDQTLVVCLFSEFGCESLVPLYGLPRLIAENPNKYIIVVGWYGRRYMYQHLADEFWELKEEFQYLRETCRAFHHESPILDNLEASLSVHGNVFLSKSMGRLLGGTHCRICKSSWDGSSGIDKCPHCSSSDLIPSPFSQPGFWRERAVLLPQPSLEKMTQASSYLKANPVGIFARDRKTYGRNLQPQFYIGLVNMLRVKGYEPIWLGEKQSTLECPVSNVVDFSRMAESRDFELTLAIVKQCKFTIQYWTASSRLAGMMGVPYLLFEMTNQIVGSGQEGYRLSLSTFGPHKIVYSHFPYIKEDNTFGLSLTARAVEEMEVGNWHDIVGLVDNPGLVEDKLVRAYPALGWER